MTDHYFFENKNHGLTQIGYPRQEKKKLIHHTTFDKAVEDFITKYHGFKKK